jgi:hypothetical protein
LVSSALDTREDTHLLLLVQYMAGLAGSQAKSSSLESTLNDIESQLAETKSALAIKVSPLLFACSSLSCGYIAFLASMLIRRCWSCIMLYVPLDISVEVHMCCKVLETCVLLLRLCNFALSTDGAPVT